MHTLQLACTRCWSPAECLGSAWEVTNLVIHWVFACKLNTASSVHQHLVCMQDGGEKTVVLAVNSAQELETLAGKASTLSLATYMVCCLSMAISALPEPTLTQPASWNLCSMHEHYAMMPSQPELLIAPCLQSFLDCCACDYKLEQQNSQYHAGQRCRQDRSCGRLNNCAGNWWYHRFC